MIQMGCGRPDKHNSRSKYLTQTSRKTVAYGRVGGTQGVMPRGGSLKAWFWREK